MKKINIHEAKAHLSRYSAALARKARKPRIGVAKGEFVVPPAFFEPLPAGLLRAFGQR